MPDTTIPVNIPQTGEVNFTFTSQLILDANKRFPDTEFGESGAIKMASLKARASREFAIGNAAHKINFGVNGALLAALGVYRKPEGLFEDLKDQGLHEKIIELLQLKISPTDNLMALRWGYEVGGNINGQIAFSPVKISFGASGEKSAMSVIARPVSRDETVKNSVTQVIEAWKAPRQVETVDNLRAGTYIITESAGELGVTLGAEYGYSYNWVKEDLAVGGLSGDLGLKIELGIKAVLKAKTSGRFALVLCRETEARKLRAQVFRLKQNGWDFAFDAGISADVDTSLPPANFDDFVKGIFNLHGLQVLKDFEKWALSDRPIEELLGQALSDYAKKLVKEVTGEDVLTSAVVNLQKALKLWNELPHKINSLLYHFIETKIDLTGLKQLLDEIISWNQSDEKLAKYIEEKLGSIDFFRTPVGRWFNALTEKGILSLMANIEDEKEQLVIFAKQTKAVLDGGATEEILKRLQDYINTKLGLDKIENLDVDEWLTKRLTEFFGKVPGVAELNKLKEAIIKLRIRADEMYKKGIKTLTQKYSLDLNYSYQKSTSSDALLDLTIDFDEAGEANGREYLKSVIAGDFNGIISRDAIPGIKLNRAVLTHEIKRNSHLEINSPFYKNTIDQINESLASAEAIDAADGRLWLFGLKSFDVKKRGDLISKLAVSAQIYERAGVRIFEKDSYRAKYQYIIAKKQADNRFIERRLELGVNKYLLSKFPAGKDFSAYLIDIDKALDKVQNNNLGNLIASLELTVPGDALSIWTKLPNDYSDPFYKHMSRVVQESLRKWLPRGYIYDPEQYERTDWIYPLFVYAALPVQERSEGDGIYYWNYYDDNRRIETIRSVPAKLNLQNILVDYLTEIPVSQRSKYLDVDKMLNAVAISKTPLTPVISRFLTLCDLEKKVIKGVVATAKNYHKFLSDTQIPEKIKYLSKFGSELTETFNTDLGGDYAGKSLRPLGLQLMLEIGKLLDPDLGKIAPAAMLEMMVVKPGVAFDYDKYRDGHFPESNELVLEQRIVTVG